MKAVIEKRARIAKIRTIEKRIAEIALARAGRDLKHIESIVERLAGLKSGLGIAEGETTAASLASRFETRLRLANASRATAAPLADAIRRQSQKQNAAMSAQQKADGADKLLQRSSDASDRTTAIRADANRIARRAPQDDNSSC